MVWRVGIFFYRWTTWATNAVLSQQHLYCNVLPHIGPSPPRGIYVRLSYNSEVCATWRTPATTNGVLALYKLYAETIDTSSDIIDAVDLPTTAVVKVCIL